MDTADRGVIAIALATASSWLGLFLHNLISLPAVTLGSPENFLPALLCLSLFVMWWRFPRRSAATLLLGWGLIQLFGGAVLTVLPLPVFPFHPEQTVIHYLAHVLYGLLQLPLILTAVPLARPGSSSLRT